MGTAYHHGDVRAAALAAAIARIENGAMPSLREIASDIGVSATALYRHFVDRDALFAAIGEEARARMVAAMGEGGSVASAARAYIGFARASPALFRLIAGSTNPFDAVVAAAHPEKSRVARRVVASQLWAQVHGATMLVLDGRIAPDDRLVSALIVQS